MNIQLINADHQTYRVFHKGLIAVVEPTTLNNWELDFDHGDCDGWLSVGYTTEKTIHDIAPVIQAMMEAEIPKRINTLKVRIELDTMELQKLIAFDKKG